jgi:hypothetical protein
MTTAGKRKRMAAKGKDEEDPVRRVRRISSSLSAFRLAAPRCYLGDRETLCV